jgi:hypothetical protein
LINDAYFYIWTLKRWTFSQKLAQFKFLPDILPERDTTTGTPINASVTKGSRRVTFSAVMDRLNPDDWEGAIFDLDNYEYIISKVVAGTKFFLTKYLSELQTSIQPIGLSRSATTHCHKTL